MRVRSVLLGLSVLLVLVLCATLDHVLLRRQATKTKRQGSSSVLYSAVESPAPSVSCSSTKDDIVLTEENIDAVEKFVIFVGYARSGHSIIGSLMDSHPDMIIAHEYMLFKKWISPDLRHKMNGNKTYLFNKMYQLSHSAVCKGLRSESSNKKGYTLHINNSWQGQFRRLRVIGDKSGGMTVNLFIRNVSNMLHMYREILKTVKVPIYSIHIIRNPFDMISTDVLYKVSDVQGKKYEPPVGTKCNNTAILEKCIARFSVIAQAALGMVRDCKLTVLDLYIEDFVMRPQESMQRICEYLGVECSPEYLQICQDKVFPNVSRTRDKVEWSEQQIEHVQQLMNTFPYLKGYNFRDDYYHHS